MKRHWKIISLVVVAVAGLGASPAHAEGRPDVAFLAGRLKADDFRVRTNAALALGAATPQDAPAAVGHLCGALSDANDVVRQATAVALKRLGRTAALPCLRARLAAEPSDVVRLQLGRAIEAIEAAGVPDAPAPSDEPKANPGAKYYVTYSIANNSGRPDLDVVVRRPIQQRLDAAGTFQLAPAKESSDVAKAVLAQRKLKGFYLAIAVDKLEYTEEPPGALTLKVKVKAAVFSYPNKDLRGEIGPKSATIGAPRRGDRATEDGAVAAVTAALVDQVAQNLNLF